MFLLRDWKTKRQNIEPMLSRFAIKLTGELFGPPNPALKPGGFHSQPVCELKYSMTVEVDGRPPPGHLKSQQPN